MDHGPVRDGFFAMGTRFECVLGAFGRPLRPAEGAATAEAVRRLVLDWHGRLSVFERGSAVSAVNQRAADRPVRVDGELFGLLERCLGYAGDTRGAFDISVGSLMHAHGLRGPASGGGAWGGAWGSGLVVLDRAAATVGFTHPGVRLDLGGVAKGFVLDLARDELLEAGVTSAIMHGGTSSVIGVGTAPDGQPWRVRALADDPASPVIDLTDTALSVSTPDGRVVEGAGHIMDPRTGRPASGGVLAACVVGASAEVCEAWSTALVVDPSLAGAPPVGYRCFVRSGDRWRSSGEPGLCCSCVCVGDEVVTDG